MLSFSDVTAAASSALNNLWRGAVSCGGVAFRYYNRGAAFLWANPWIMLGCVLTLLALGTPFWLPSYSPPASPRPQETTWTKLFHGRPIFILGDSTVAAGNFMMTKFPYGVDLPNGTVTGRFSNGFTIADYAAIQNGSPIPQPQAPLVNGSLGGDWKSIHGVNFASAGCGILNRTHPPEFSAGSCASLAIQIEQLFALDMDSSSFGTAVFFISMGSNDYLFSYHGKDSEGFAEILVTLLESTLKSLYERGARQFLINNIGPVGCIPNKRNRVPNPVTGEKECDEDLNKSSKVFNRRLERALRGLAVADQDATFVLADSGALFSDIVKTPAKYGFTVIEEPCCGTWDPAMTMYLCSIMSGFCPNRKEVLFFDGAHTSDEANKLFINSCFEGKICHNM